MKGIVKMVDRVITAQIILILFLSFKVAEFLLEKGADVNNSNVSFKLFPHRNEKQLSKKGIIEPRSDYLPIYLPKTHLFSKHLKPPFALYFQYFSFHNATLRQFLNVETDLV